MGFRFIVAVPVLFLGKNKRRSVLGLESMHVAMKLKFFKVSLLEVNNFCIYTYGCGY
jgi:hypothetical protein